MAQIHDRSPPVASEALEVTVVRSLEDEIFRTDGEWDQLLARSRADTIFLTSGWLQAWAENYGKGKAALVPTVRCNGQLIAAAAFIEHNGVLEFAGVGPSDYLDFVIAADLDDATVRRTVDALLRAARNATNAFRHFLLRRVPLENGTLEHLSHSENRYHATLLGSVQAPSMDMSAAPEKLKKKSLLRHDRGLSRHGLVEVDTHTHADAILSRLDAFFDQHVRRWNETPYPSLFCDPTARDFYRALTRHLDRSGWLRFTEIRLDGRLVAAHFGFLYGGRFIWYKPCYEPELAKLSPGEVLIKRLIETAQEADASEFDFTIGEEAFKKRFATKERTVADIHITDSLIVAWRRRARLAITKTVRNILGETIWAKIKNRLAPRG